MVKRIGGIVLILMGFVIVKPVHAFIIIPALILIPIAHIVAAIIGGFSLPAMGLGLLWSKLTEKSLPKGIAFGMSFIIIAAVVIAIVLKVLSPERPFL